jgi:hypothetical protein
MLLGIKMIKQKYAFLFLGMLLASMVFSCKQTELTPDPYSGGKGSLGLTFETKTIEPEFVNAGDLVTVRVKGLKDYLDNFKVYVNEVEAEIQTSPSLTNDSTLTIKVPADASTGSMWITAKGQTFFGPIVKIAGKVSVDNTWLVVNGSNGPILDIEQLLSGRFMVGGFFNDFELKATPKVPIGGIAQITPDGAYYTSTTEANYGKGAGGASMYVSSINKITSGTESGKYIIAGSFASFNSTRSNRQTLNSIARLTSTGQLDTLVLSSVINPKPEETYKNGDTISAFNGGVDGSVRRAMVWNNQIYVVGGFQNYKRMFVRGSSYDQKLYDFTKMKQIVRLNMDGSMDSTYRFDPVSKQSPAGANGGISDTFVQADGKLVLVGSFTTFDGVPANRIIRLNVDGTIDNTFNIGMGANADINSIRWNEVTQKMVITGNFTQFNGKSVVGINLMDANGVNIDSFVPQAISGGSASFAGQLNNGKIIVAGSFNRYGSYLRQGFMIINADGSLAIGYNNTGGFQGVVYDMFESTASGTTKVVLVGGLLRFNAILPKNIMRLTLTN